jgi:hypothetical protein
MILLQIMAKILIDSNLTHLKSYLKVINKVQKLMVSGNMFRPALIKLVL